jgi:hypothetical protein
MALRKNKLGSQSILGFRTCIPTTKLHEEGIELREKHNLARLKQE